MAALVSKAKANAAFTRDSSATSFVWGYARIARWTGLKQPRVTEIVNATLLAPEIQEEIFSDAENDEAVVERRLRDLADTNAWPRQCAQWARLPRSTG